MQAESAILWRLDKLLEDWADVQINHSATDISGLSLDSRSTCKGDLFFATKGLQQHGIEYGQQAIANGAVALAWESSADVQAKDLPENVPCFEVEHLQAKLGFICQRFYRNISENMNVIAVTGTDGKTSVSQFIAQALHQLDVPCGVIGTLGYGVFPELDVASHTTPDAVRTHGLLNNLYVNDIHTVMLEASSHGLQQGRLNGVEVDTAIFTNLGRDHMDYHESMEAYFQSKRLLFANEKLKNAVINIDDSTGLRLVEEFSKKLNVITYSITGKKLASNSYINAMNFEYQSGVTKFEIDSSYGSAKTESKLVGKFNISNLLAVIGSLISSDVAFNKAVDVIASIKTVPGRMEFIDHLDESSKQYLPEVVIDYAHTPQALSNVLKVLKGKCTGTLWCVFGCGGNRDQGKRTLMAQAVEQYADVAIITDDNPRFENPEAITDEIKSGFSSTSKYFLIHDRRQAIEYAIQNANQQDIVLIAGKGHEAVQIIEQKHLPFDDKAIANETLLGIAP